MDDEGFVTLMCQGSWQRETENQEDYEWLKFCSDGLVSFFKAEETKTFIWQVSDLKLRAATSQVLIYKFELALVPAEHELTEYDTNPDLDAKHELKRTPEPEYQNAILSYCKCGQPTLTLWLQCPQIPGKRKHWFQSVDSITELLIEKILKPQ